VICPFKFFIEGDDVPYTQKEYKKKFHHPKKELLVPCGKCIACRSNRAAEWGIRLQQEAEFHQEKCFITLTYNDKELPVLEVGEEKIPTLYKPDYQKFLKRLRKKLKDTKIKYFLCGEYGEKEGRPHYHIIILGWKPKMETLIKERDYWFSPELEKVWQKGIVQVGGVTNESIFYTTGYLLKATDQEGNLRAKSFNAQSGGIGKSWLEENEEEVIKNEIKYEGKELPVPRYYRKKLKEKGIEIDYSKIKSDKKEGELALMRKMVNQGRITDEEEGYEKIVAKVMQARKEAMEMLKTEHERIKRILK
jgi:hypothetical protein